MCIGGGGQAVLTEEDPGDKLQMTKVSFENSLDLGFSMPVYTKRLTLRNQPEDILDYGL